MTRPHLPPDETELYRTAAVTCPQDRGENPFGWSDLPPAADHQEATVTDTAPMEAP